MTKRRLGGFALCLAMLALAACGSEEEEAETRARPVRSVIVEERSGGVPVVLTGSIEPEDEARLGFRIGGRMIERLVDLGDEVEPGEIIARLEPQNETNALRTAEANVQAAKGELDTARAEYQRQQHLADRGFAAMAVYERARQAQQTAQSRLDAAQAQLKFAQDQIDFTELRADAEGVVTAIGAEPGEVVQTGQMIVTLAREGGRDAVFDVPAQVLRSAPSDPEIDVFLTDQPSIQTTGLVREVAQRADPVTRTFEVRVGLHQPPQEMRLGATVTGRMELDDGLIIEIPATALTRLDGQPAVWIVDPEAMTVSMRAINVLRFEPSSVVVADGLDPGEIVVSAGVQALHAGQQVRLLEG